jgi:hypothetical protein
MSFIIHPPASRQSNLSLIDCGQFRLALATKDTPFWRCYRRFSMTPWARVRQIPAWHYDLVMSRMKLSEFVSTPSKAKADQVPVEHVRDKQDQAQNIE